MASALDLPLLHALVPDGLEFPSVLCVEFDPQAPWIDVGLTLLAQALRAGVPCDFHLFQQGPEDARRDLRRFGIDPGPAGEGAALRLIDSFGQQTGLRRPSSGPDPEPFFATMRLSEWGTVAERHFAENIPAVERGRFHLDDNLQALARYNSEEEILDHWRTRVVPVFRASGSILLNAVSAGTLSPSFYPRFESLCDGVLELRTVEDGGRIDQRIRLRALRGRRIDTRWHSLRGSGEGEVTLGPSSRNPVAPEAPPPPSRRLVAIMFTDLVGFTRLAQRDEALALRMRAEHQAAVRPLFLRFGGREVKSMGDGFLVVFPSAVESLRCGLAIQEETAARNRQRPNDPPIELRIGLHVGDVVEEGDDIVGDAVNVASRIEGIAEPGGVFLSGAAREQIGNKVAGPFEPCGAASLKNVDLPVPVFRVRPAGPG